MASTKLVMADKDLNYIVSKTKISTVYLQKDVTLYRKELPFTRIRELLGNV
jgi:predicted transcriptional regulator